MIRNCKNRSCFGPVARVQCCGSILSLVYIVFSMFFGMVMCDNDFETKENNI